MERLESNEYPMSTESYKAYVDAALATGKPVNIVSVFPEPFERV